MGGEDVTLSSPKQSQKFNLPGKLCSVSAVQYYFEYITKIDEKFAENLSIKIYFNTTENRIAN